MSKPKTTLPLLSVYHYNETITFRDFKAKALELDPRNISSAMVRS